MSKRKVCCIEGCDAPVEDVGCCVDHMREWMRSPEFRAATDDVDVRFLMSLGAKSLAMRKVTPYRRRWAKRVNEENAR